jgi:hypothetical protein
LLSDTGTQKQITGITRTSPERGIGPGTPKFKTQNPRVVLNSELWILDFLDQKAQISLLMD